ncbi:hypothetical protein ABIA33_007357 [Streptacidiphilus sp. MAP12-16]|uniref:hypothetical protein n=1 Tax=Streptacidiphilus sp. MAP12-16 TaxID=3156300 RepID=UPI0035155C97
MSQTTNTPNALDIPQLTGVTGPAAAIWTELHDRPHGATVAAVALSVGVSRSTASKALTALEDQGLTWRTNGGNDRTRRLPDQWHLTTPNHTEPTDTAASGASDRTADPDEKPLTPPNDSSDTTHDTDTEDTEDQTAAPGEVTPHVQDTQADTDQPHPGTAPDATDGEAGAHETTAGEEVTAGQEVTVPAPQAHQQPTAATADGAKRPEADDTPLPPASGDAVPAGAACPTCGHRQRPAAPQAATSGGPRLGQGQLHQLALEHLRAHPEKEWTATGIGKVIGRSSGAIANALATMVTRGEAELTCAAPRRYQALSQPVPTPGG